MIVGPTPTATPNWWPTTLCSAAWPPRMHRLSRTATNRLLSRPGPARWTSPRTPRRSTVFYQVRALTGGVDDGSDDRPFGAAGRFRRDGEVRERRHLRRSARLWGADLTPCQALA